MRLDRSDQRMSPWQTLFPDNDERHVVPIWKVARLGDQTLSFKKWTGLRSVSSQITPSDSLVL